MSRFRTVLIVMAGLVAGLSFSPGAQAQGVQPVPQLDLQRYQGDWRQVASIPQWFELFCQRNTRANYTLKANGAIRVLNRCDGPFGITIPIEGEARRVDPSVPAALQVTFSKRLFSDEYRYSDNRANYQVIGLGSNYEWAVVGEDTRSSAFVLSRAPFLTDAEEQQVADVLRTNGYDACRLQTTPQDGGFDRKVSVCELASF